MNPDAKWCAFQCSPGLWVGGCTVGRRVTVGLTDETSDYLFSRIPDDEWLSWKIAAGPMTLSYYAMLAA